MLKAYVCEVCRRIWPPRPQCPQCGRALEACPPGAFVGQDFGGYRLRKLLGAGAMGAVFLAERDGAPRPVALKTMIPEDEEPTEVKRFLQEARLLSELRHPNIIEVYESSTSEWGTPYYTMEVLEGLSLREKLRGCPDGLPFDEVLVHARQLAEGLRFAHDRGVVHRDLKPENVHLVETPTGPCDKILDFGLAKSVLRPQTTRLTRSGLLLGTPNYIAPEQIRNEGLGPHTDQYSFGLIVAELITGRKVRQGHSVVDIVLHDANEPLPPDVLGRARVPAGVLPALLRATRPDPSDRFPDVVAFVRALAGEGPLDVPGPHSSAARGDARSARASGVGTQARRRTAPPSRTRVLWLTLVGLGLAAAAVGAWLLLR